MKLSLLLEPWVSIDSEVAISGLQQDSRLVKPGDLFLAYPGAVADGRLFLAQVIASGAVAILYEPSMLPDSFVLPEHSLCIPLVGLAGLRGVIASRFYGDPTRTLSVVGVTGTNGKTTIAYQLTQAHEHLGRHAAYIGTLGQGLIHHIEPSNNTTPDPLFLQRFMYEVKHEGVRVVCMEVSSHALVQGRVGGVNFTQAIYTNLSHEHLDYHETMQAYAQAKAQLFTCPTLKWAIVNHDDAYATLMAAQIAPSCQILTYGLASGCDVFAFNLIMDRRGSTFDVDSPWGRFTVSIKMIGRFNVYNSLAVLSSLLSDGYDPKGVIDIMRVLEPSPGRMEIVSTHPCVIVDYAHTPDALENALSTVKQLSPCHLVVVFGCGGDRDKTKRPLMGEVASRYVDQIILTSDNPRTEDPLTIIHDVAQGIPSSSNRVIMPDRKEAIRHALTHAHPDDLILIAGKGHEDYQQIGDKRFPFSDQRVVLEFLAEK